jgi:serine/threonine protein kinase
MTRQVIEREKLGALAKIGQGGQGVVYGAPNVKTKFAASMVYKEYKPQVLAGIDFNALAAMPALVEDSLSYAEAERLISIAAWPCALVEDASATTGFVMPAIPEEFFIELSTVKGMSRAAAEFQHLLNHSSVLAARGININDAQRYSVLREVASGLAFLHKHEVCVGDISPKNLLFSLVPHETIYFIDCDAMRINGVSVLPQVETPGWQAPAGEELATIYTDTYKLGLLALRLLAGDHDTTNPAHLPATTPDMLRQIITDTLTSQSQQRPLPEAWTYVLGNAIETAQHNQKTAAAAQPNTPLAPPPTPIVHSRPSTPQSQPPPPPPPPLPPPRAADRLPPPAAWAQPTRAPSSSKTPLLIGVSVAVVAVAASIVAVVVMTNRNSNAPTSAPVTGTSTYPSDSYASATTSAATTSTWAPPTASVRPPLVEAPDSYGVSCPNGYQLSGHSGWATNAGRGTDGTSCQFANNVLLAYWNSYPSPSRDSRQVMSPGTVACTEVSTNCSGNEFIMTCAVNGNDPWITCTGGRDAIIYLY